MNSVKYFYCLIMFFFLWESLLTTFIWQILQICAITQFKGTVSLISSDPLFKERNPRFKTVPLKPWLIKDLQRYPWNLEWSRTHNGTLETLTDLRGQRIYWTKCCVKTRTLAYCVNSTRTLSIFNLENLEYSMFNAVYKKFKCEIK